MLELGFCSLNKHFLSFSSLCTQFSTLCRTQAPRPHRSSHWQWWSWQRSWRRGPCPQKVSSTPTWTKWVISLACQRCCRALLQCDFQIKNQLICWESQLQFLVLWCLKGGLQENKQDRIQGRKISQKKLIKFIGKISVVLKFWEGWKFSLKTQYITSPSIHSCVLLLFSVLERLWRWIRRWTAWQTSFMGVRISSRNWRSKRRRGCSMAFPSASRTTLTARYIPSSSAFCLGSGNRPGCPILIRTG